MAQQSVHDKLNRSLDGIIEHGGSGGKQRRERKTAQRTPYARSSNSSGARPKKIGYRAYVGNLGYRVSWQDLKDLMSAAGEVLHANILELPDGRSKGCGVVEFATKEAQQRAIQELTGTEVKGRPIFVREDREGKGFGQGQAEQKEVPRHVVERQYREFARMKGGAGAQVYVGNLNWRASWQDLKDLCAPHGRVVHVDIETDRETGRSRGFGKVIFGSNADAEAAINALHGTNFQGRELEVRHDRKAKDVEAGTAVYIGNLSYGCSWRDLKALLDPYGQCHADVILDAKGKSRGFGTAVFSDAAAAQHAINELNNTNFMGRVVELRHRNDV